MTVVLPTACRPSMHQSPPTSHQCQMSSSPPLYFLRFVPPLFVYTNFCLLCKVRHGVYRSSIITLTPHALLTFIHMHANSRAELLKHIRYVTSIPFTSFHLMAPKKKGGVSRKVRITGPYSRPEEPEPGPTDSAVPTSTPTTSLNHLLSISQVAAARETAHVKCMTQLQSKCLSLLVPVY